MPDKEIFEDLLEDRDALFLAQVAKPVGIELFLRTFDNESRGVIVELMGMRPDPTFVGFLKNEHEGVVKPLVRTEPGKLAVPQIDHGFEPVLVEQPCFGVQTVARHHSIIVFCKGLSVFNVAFKPQVHT